MTHREASPRALEDAARTRGRGGPGVARCLAAALLAALVPLLAASPVASARTARPRSIPPRSIPVSVSVDAAEPGPSVPRDFLGLSFELYSLPQVAGDAGRGDLVTLLRSLGDGVLRFGGVTADSSIAWVDAATRLPAWTSNVLEAGDLVQLGGLAAASGWRVLLTIGLGHFQPEVAAREAAAARAALGESLEAIELGNEPNAFAEHGLRAEPWTVVEYDEQIAAYRSAIEAVAPGISLAGPDVSGAGAFETWGLGEVIYDRPALLTGHFYALGCSEVPAPSIARLLSRQIAHRNVASLRHYLPIAESAETPFRLDETNNISCAGVAGVSNTFASALWATSSLTTAMQMGVEGVNMHGSLANCGGYGPLCAPSAEDLAAGELRAQPEWYALLLLRALIGDRPIKTITRAPATSNIVVSTFLAANGTLQFVVVDDDPPGARRAAVRLRVGGGFAGARILSLTGPSPSALSGVRLGGRAVAADGTWTPPPRLPQAANRGGVITVEIAPSSAALLTVSHRAHG
jgi:hypothetical protein